MNIKVRTRNIIALATVRFSPTEPTDDIMRTRYSGSSANIFTTLARCWNDICPSIERCLMPYKSRTYKIIVRLQKNTE